MSGLNRVLRQIPAVPKRRFLNAPFIIHQAITYLLNCSAKMRLVDVPVMVMRPPMVAAYVMLSDRHLQIM